MKKGKKIVTGILGLALAFSAFGAGYAAFADYPELPRAVADAAGDGLQATAPASSFDSNGWFTQDGYNALVNGEVKPENVVGPAPGYLGYLAPEAIGGYTAMATFGAGKIINNKQLSVTNEISFEVGNQATGDHGNTFMYFVDSDEIGSYLSLTETKTKLGVMFNGAASQAQIFAKGAQRGATATLDATNLKTIWSGAPNAVMHYVSVKIGAAGETTKVYIDNKLVVETADVTQADFVSGKVQLVWSHWGGGGQPWAFVSAFDPFTIVKAPAAKNPITVNEFKGDIVVDLTKPVSAVTVVNAKGETVTLEKGTDYTAEGNVVTIKNAFLTGQAAGFFKSDTRFTFKAEDNRVTNLNVTLLSYEPPVYQQQKPETVGAALEQDLTFEVSYTNEETYTVSVNGKALAAEHYTAVWAENVITVTLKKDYINELKQGTYTFELATLAGSVEYVVYRKTASNEWVSMRDGTVTDGSAVGVEKGDAGSSTVNLGFMSHAYYSDSIDVSKTIYLEMDFNTVNSDTHPHGWFAIGFTNDVTKVNNLNESNSADRLTFLYGHAKGEFQCAGVLANAALKPEYVNQNGPQLFAITFADADAEGNTVAGSKTTLYFNGYKIFETDTKNKATFANGCYLGLFSAVDVLNITMRTDVSSPVANTYGLEYTLGADTDIEVPMYNTSAVSAVRYGDKQLAATDYSFAEGKLVIKGSYLKTIAYADVINLVVTANGVDVKVNVKTLSEVDPAKSYVAYTGENGAEYTDFAGKTVLKVIDMNTSSELAAQDDYAVTEDGTLILNSANFTQAGVYGYAVVTEEGLYFAMAIHYDYDENGLCNNIEAENGTFADGKLTVSGESNYAFKGLIDLTKEEGVTYTLDISKLNGYFKSGMDGSVQAYIAISLYDMYSGNTITLKLFANDTADSGVSLTYTELVVRDKNGKPVYVNNAAIPDTTNYFDDSILTENVVKFTVDGNSLVVELNEEIMYLDLGNTVMTALQLSVSSTADIDGEKNAYSFAVKTNAGTNPDPVDPDDKDPEEPAKKGGCNGSVGIVGGALALPVLFAAGAVVLKKKKSDQ